MTAEKFKSICEYKGITWNDLVRIRIIRPKKFLGFFRQLTGITIEGAFNRCSACVEIMANDDNGVSMMHYIDYEDIIGYEQFWIIGESVCPAIAGEAGYSKEEFDKVNKENKDPELKSINSFNDTVKKANEIKDRVLKYVDKIKRERAYNIDLCMTFERYVEIADKDAERAMAFLKEAYPFNEETEVFIRKRYNMSIDVDPEEN